MAKLTTSSSPEVWYGEESAPSHGPSVSPP
jgi:hypothetical protein